MKPYRYRLLVVLTAFAAAVSSLPGGNAVAAGGTVLAWGNNDYGQDNVPAGLTNAIAVTGGQDFSLALRTDGTVVAWGNNFGITNLAPTLSNIVAISAASFQAIALKNDGTVVAWGDNSYDQTNIPAGLSNVTAIAAGGYHHLVLKADGSILAWGRNDEGQLNVPPGLGIVTAIACGTHHCLALRADGTIATWGGNLWGQMNVPPGISNVIAISAGGYHNVVLKRDGTVIAWGGQTQTAPGMTNFVTIASATFNDLGLRPDGSLWGWDNTTFGNTGYTNVIAMGGGVYHNLGIINDGSPVILRQPLSQTILIGKDATFIATAVGPALKYQWQWNSTNLTGQTNVTLTLTNVQPANDGNYTLIVSNSINTVTSSNAVLVVSLTPEFTLQPTNQDALLGHLTTLDVSAIGPAPINFQWQKNGSNITGATNTSFVIPSMHKSDAGQYRAIASNPHGATTSLVAVITAREVAAWGDNNHGEIDVPIGLSNVTAIAASYSHSLVLKSDGTMAAWGQNDYGEGSVPDGISNVKAIVSAPQHNVALKNDGTVVSWGRDYLGRIVVPDGLTNVVAIAANYYQGLAVTSDSQRDRYPVEWGSSNQAAIPPGYRGIEAIASGGGSDWIFGLVVTNGRVTGWGHNSFGEVNVPAGLSNVVQVSAGSSHSMALTADGKIVAWGDNFLGQTNVPPGLSNIVAISAGNIHSLALRNDGKVFAWGYNNGGQTNVPSDLSNVVAIAGGGEHSLALVNDGSPWVVRQTLGQTVTSGTSASFSVTVTGVPVTYQWQFNGSNIFGATNSVLMLTNVPLSAQGNYSVVISNAVGSIVSSNAFLTVQRSVPVFDTSPGGFFFNSNGANLHLTGLSGHGPVIIYASSNLVNWQPIFTNPAVLGGLFFIDPASTNMPTRFYRAGEQ